MKTVEISVGFDNAGEAKRALTLASIIRRDDFSCSGHDVYIALEWLIEVLVDEMHEEGRASGGQMMEDIPALFERAVEQIRAI